jgi:hypothetical protein
MPTRLLHFPQTAEAAKQEAIQEVKRKRKFNPLHANLKVSPADAPAAPPAAPSAAPGSAAAAATNEAPITDKQRVTSAGAAPSGSSVAAAGARFAARPRAVPTGLQQQQQQQQPQQQQQVVRPAPSRPVASTPAAQQQQQQQPDFLQLQEVLDAADDDGVDDIADVASAADPELAAMLAELMAAGADDVPEVQPLPAKAVRRQSPAQQRVAAIAKRAVTQQFRRKQQRAMLQAAAGDDDDDYEVDAEDDESEEQVPASRGVAAAGEAARAGVAGAGAKMPAQQAAAGKDAAAADGEDADDDLDWEALGQYEQLEKYLGQLQKENSGAAPRRAKLDPSAAVVKPPAAAAAAAAVKPPAAATAAAAAAKPAAAAATSSPPAAKVMPQVAKPMAAAGAGAGAGAGAATKRAKGSSSSSRMDKDLDELEQLVSMLQAMEGSSSSSRQQQLQRPAGAGGSSSAAAGSDPGDALLKALLGADWEAELLDDLAAVIDDEDDEQAPQPKQKLQQQQQRPALGSGSGQQLAQNTTAAAAHLDAEDEEEDEDPWADEVTGLLLGLVSISHKKYLGSEVPLSGGVEAVGEDERCAAFWQAPWALFVVDDSAQSCIEYVNEAAGSMFGGGYLDLFGRATHELVGADLTAQVGEDAAGGRQGRPIVC